MAEVVAEPGTGGPGGTPRLLAVSEAVVEVLTRVLLPHPAALPALLPAGVLAHGALIDRWIDVAATRHALPHGNPLVVCRTHLQNARV